MSITARPITPEEHAQGYYVCGCGNYAHVFRSGPLLPIRGYNGELCRECNLWVTAVDKLKGGER